MKKLILVVGILTQSYFGISQKFEIVKSNNLPYLSGEGIGSGVEFSVVSLTHDNNYIYGLSLNPSNYIIRFDPKTLEVIDALVTDLPDYTYKEVRGMKTPDGITYAGGYLWVAYAPKRKIYKLNKYTGKVLDSIPGPPLTKLYHQYNGFDFDGKYFWLIRNEQGGNDVVLYKLSKSGKILDERKISNTYSLGLHYYNGNLYTIMYDENPENTLSLKKYSISSNSFTESYPTGNIRDVNGCPNGVTMMGKYIYFTTGYSFVETSRKILKLKVTRE